MEKRIEAALVYLEDGEARTGEAFGILGEKKYSEYARLPLSLASAVSGRSKEHGRLFANCLKKGKVDLDWLIYGIGRWAEALGYRLRLLDVESRYGEAESIAMSLQEPDEPFSPDASFKDTSVILKIGRTKAGYSAEFVLDGCEDALIDMPVSIYPKERGKIE